MGEAVVSPEAEAAEPDGSRGSGSRQLRSSTQAA